MTHPLPLPLSRFNTKKHGCTHSLTCTLPSCLLSPTRSFFFLHAHIQMHEHTSYVSNLPAHPDFPDFPDFTRAGWPAMPSFSDSFSIQQVPATPSFPESDCQHLFGTHRSAPSDRYLATPVSARSERYASAQRRNHVKGSPLSVRSEGYANSRTHGSREDLSSRVGMGRSMRDLCTSIDSSMCGLLDSMKMQAVSQSPPLHS